MFHVKQFEKLAEYCLKNGIRYGQTEEERFKTFYEFLVEKNKVMNLTAVTEPEEVELRHYIDSVFPESREMTRSYRKRTDPVNRSLWNNRHRACSR